MGKSLNCGTLKVTHIIPPVIALAGAAGWLGSQHQSISALERECSILQKAIAAKSSGGAVSFRSAGTTAATKTANEKEPLDWKKIAARLTESNGTGSSDIRSGIKLQQRLMAMSREELITALDQIATLDLPDDSRMQLERMLIGPLAEKDPEFVLRKFIDRSHDDHHRFFAWTLSRALQIWVKKDPVSATSWFDQEIAAGKFDSRSLDGKSGGRIRFEGSLIHTLLGTDPEAAADRLAALPAAQRKEALNQFQFALKKEDELAFANLVRGQLPQEEQAASLGQHAGSLVAAADGYAKVAEFLGRIQATPAERIAGVENALESKIILQFRQKKITREDLNTMRDWASAQAPVSKDVITGKALAAVAGYRSQTDFPATAELALEYHLAAGNDDVLFTFLESRSARQNQEQALVLAEKINDPKRREEILKKLR